WVTAPTRPQHLLAVAPTMNYASHKHFFFEGGVFRTTFMKAILALQARERAQLGLPIISDEAWAHGGESWMTHLPLAELPLMKEFPYWAEWVNNPVESDYWKPVDIEAQHDQITVPALNITGWHDDYYGQPGAIRNFEGMRAGGGSDRARRGQRLIIGPWSHGDPSLTNTSALGVDYGLNAGIDFIELQLRFFDYWLKGIDDGYTKEPPVRIFVMGDNVWRDEHEWPLARTRYTDLHLNTGGVLAAAAPTADSSDTFVYDPRHPLRIPHLDASGKGVAVDWDSVISRDDVLTYTSAPFDSDTEITGQILAKLWISSTAPDTDFSARVLVVEPSGHMCPLTRDPGMLRARYRNTEDLQPPRPLTPSEPTELTISLGYTSYVIKSGHRLRVFVAGSVFPAVHLNVWGPFTSMSQAVMAKQTVHHTPVHASKIVLPVVPR
ncbi:MAG: CocE/NonD family hydrolase, partial [Mesorhizobium sp.]